MKTKGQGLAMMLAAWGVMCFAGLQPLSGQVDYHGGALTARQHGYQHGYKDGYESVRGSSLSNRDQDLRNQRRQAKGNGYQPYFGSEEEYSQGYREGFDDGARDSSDGVRSRLEDLFRWQDPNFNPDRSRMDPSDQVYRENHWTLEHVAGDIGYRDGLNAGVRDRQQRSAFQPRKRLAWRNGIHGYDASLGSLKTYRGLYRAAYEEGYRDGYGGTR